MALLSVRIHKAPRHRQVYRMRCNLAKIGRYCNGVDCALRQTGLEKCANVFDLKP